MLTHAAAPQDRRPLVISGPSGAVSHTTRQPRPGETDGISYHFVSVETYKSLKTSGGLLEDAMYTNDFYGTSKAALEEIFDRQLIPILDIEMNGVQQV
ncbi:hypothetical protein N7516_003833 [Penicillium verrucosum]|uniref:uncharacterized protein n=1 Tax=Penicillium verrucosum TaxID=60171 RepID=UPI00254518AC|nr:uncharacterized protein N7516_003833 [Penicillium verrucosum]KAJ5943665.1 hypothetical protein N7516_003833 [Penicillium verrucosum]